MMKIKFLALTAFMLCLVMLLASCGAQETVDGNQSETGVCAETVDADNDGKCDNCGHDAALPETEIPVMVVKPVPENSNADEYFVFNYDGEEVPFSKHTSLTGNIELNDAINGGRIVVLKYSNSVSAAGTPTEQQMMKDYYNIYDLEANQSIYFFASSEYLNGTSPKETYTFGCGDYYVSIQKSVLTEIALPEGPSQTVIVNSWDFRTNAGDYIISTNTLTRLESEIVGDVFYLTVNDFVIPIDVNTHKRVTLADGTIDSIPTNADTFVMRPAFDYIHESYGYVYENNDQGNICGLQVYDLNEWLECIYSYDVASYEISDETYMGVLQNGNVILQTLVPLHKNAKAYDIVENGNKFDMVYTVINPFEQTTSEVEFGYFIVNVFESVECDFIADAVKAPNVAFACPVVDDHIDRSNIRTFAIDNDFNILAECEKILPGQYSATKYAVGDGLYVVELYIGDGFVEAVVDAEGNFIEYLPENYFEGDGFIVAGRRIYGYDMKEKFNLSGTGGEYTIIEASRGFLILSKPNFSNNEILDYFYFNPAKDTAPVEIASDRVGSTKTFYSMLGSGLFVISEALPTAGGAPIFRYYVYNSDNTNVIVLNQAPQFVGEYEDVILIFDGTTHYAFSAAVDN